MVIGARQSTLSCREKLFECLTSAGVSLNIHSFIHSFNKCITVHGDYVKNNISSNLVISLNRLVQNTPVD